MRLFRPLATLLLALAIGACAKAQSQPEPDLAPPPKKPFDAKTQLETGRRY